jgi:GMP synthase-like glutamine amidotransferase
MRAHYLQHVPFEGLGCIEPWLKSQGAEVTATKFFESTSLPAVAEFDLLIILGGPMSVNDEEKFPWLRQEKNFIHEAILQQKAILGICLGAQLIAAAMGEAVYPNRRKEIGWFPITRVPAPPECFTFPARLDVFHWHGETFDLPHEAQLLARTEGCENQAFQLGKRVIGLQFHLESTPDSVRLIITNCRDELLPSKYVQPEQIILDQSPAKYRKINQLMADLLRFLTSQPTEAAT